MKKLVSQLPTKSYILRYKSRIRPFIPVSSRENPREYGTDSANSAGFLSHLNGRKKGKESKIKIEIISETFGGRREGCDFFAFLKRLGEKSWHCVRRRSKTWMRRSLKKVLCVVPHLLQRKNADLCLMPRICAA